MAKDVPQEAEGQEAKKGGKGLLIVLILVIVLLIAGMGVMAWMLMSGGGEDKAEGEQPVAEEAAGFQPPQIQYSPQFKQYPPPGPDAQPQYFEMKFVVNFKGEGKARFLAVDLKFMSRFTGVVEDMEHIRPILLNDITLLLRQQTYTELAQDSGPELLREKILQTARAAAETNRIYPDLIENVFLTRFVMQ
jgi:flagellar FliL protein